MLKSSIALIGLFISSFSINAAIIDNGSYITDSATGLDWLDLTTTDGQSFNAVSTRITTGGDLEGWNFATTFEFEILMTSFGATLMTGCLIPESSLCGWSSDNNEIVMTVLGLMGNLSGSRSSLGLLLEEDNITQPDHHFAAYLYDETHPTGKETTEDFINSYYKQQADGTGGTATGSFLIRTSVVPVPAAAWLFGSGLLGLIGMARRTKAT